MESIIGSLSSCKLETCNDVVSTVQPSAVPSNSAEAMLGRHIARRLVQIGVSDVFSAPDDFNLTLLDHLIAEPGLNLARCCNELTARYAAYGYARAQGVGACVVTLPVGGRSILNPGAYSENLPVICIVGAPLPDLSQGAALLRDCNLLSGCGFA